MSLRIFFLSLFSVLMAAGCSSSKLKERKEQREKVAQSTKIYCEFINGEMYPDIDVGLNLEMAKRCDFDKPFSMTNYKTPTENPGILYCCSISGRNATASAATKKRDTKEEKKEDKSNEIAE